MICKQAGRFVSAMVLLMGMVPAMHGAVQNRIASVGSKAVELPKSVSSRVAKATDGGEASGSTALTSMALHFSMTANQTATLKQLLVDQQNPSSAKYHQWLTPEQFGAQFGLSASDQAQVTQWLTAQGFKITQTSRSGTFVRFSGTVAQAQAAFHTSIHTLTENGETHFANVTNAAVPAGLANVVGTVGGLDDFKLKPHVQVKRVPAATQAGAKFTESATGDHFTAPGDFATIYDTTPLLTNSINGTGITIAVAGQIDITLSDMAAFRTAGGLSANPPTLKLYGTDPGNKSTDDVEEASLDVEWAGAVAPSASVLFVYSTNVFDSLIDIVDDNLAPIASISYGNCESALGQTNLIQLNQSLMQGNAEGITIIGPAGDSGATDCDYQEAAATQGLAVDFPAASPYVTGAGGSSFIPNDASYYSATNGANSGSALSYIPETVWNESVTNGQLEAGGGGVSSFFAKPYWQTGTGVPADFGRDVPDISLSASPDQNGYLICVQGSCVNGYSSTSSAACTNDNCLTIVGGTSISAPTLAGIMALVEQKIGSRIGNANPTIYALANSTSYATVFHDITTGDNTSPCTAGSTGCASGVAIGYNAGVGYDLASGWGSVDAFALANAWTTVTPATSSLLVSTTTLQESIATVNTGTAVTLTVSVASGDTSSTITPTGTVQFLVDNATSGTAVALSGGIATYSLDTTALSSGNHTLSATYSGDTLYAGSKSSVNLDLTSATAADFTLTPTTGTLTASVGGTSSGLVFTVTPVNGFTGNVTFNATTSSTTLSNDGNDAFSPTIVDITGTAAGTTTLTLYAYNSDVATANNRTRIKLANGATKVSQNAPAGKTGWIAGSGATLACLLLFVVPKRRRFGALLGVMLSVAALGGMMGLSGCGGSSSTTTTQLTVPAGSYSVTVTATATNAAGTALTHNSTVTFTVQ